MALSAATVFEIRNQTDFTGASDTNGGGFVTGASGTDWTYTSLPAGGYAKYNLSDGHYVSGTTLLLSEASADMIGNIAYISGGTGSITGNWYQITGQSTSTSISLDRSTGLVAGTGISVVIGGCLATPGGLGKMLSAVGVTGMFAWMKYSTTQYGLTSSSSNVSGGVCSISIASNFEGYDQIRGDRTGNRPQISWGVTGTPLAAPGGNTYMITLTGATKKRCANITFNGLAVNNVSGINSADARSLVVQCVAENCSGTNGVGLDVSNALSCYANTCLVGYTATYALSCTASGCTTGFSVGAFVKCLAYSNTTGFSISTLGAFALNCTSDNNTTGYTISNAVSVMNCIASNSSGTGFTSTGASVVTLDNCAGYNNNTDVTTGTDAPLTNEGFIPGASFSGQPYVSAGSDYRANAIAGAGALLRNAGIGVYGQTDNVDLGAVQHSDTGAVLSRVFSGF